MNKVFRIFFIAFTVVFVLNSCVEQGGQPGQSSSSGAAPSVSVPVFSPDSALNFVAKQIAFGPRVPNTPASEACAQWLESTMRRFTPHVAVQPFRARAFDGTILNGRNVIASFNPEAQARILLCAHWDSRPWADHDPDQANHQTPIDGANDGASGVGVLLEVARMMAMQPPTVGVDIVLFDAEDYGPTQAAQGRDSDDAWGLGSQHWAKNPHVAGYRARYGILLDMVGVENATFLQEGYSLYYAPHIVKRVWNIARQAGYGSSFIDAKGGYITDDHYYVNLFANIPTINIIHLQSEGSTTGFYPHWHTIHDNLEKVSPVTLGIVTDVVLQVVYRER